ncbi:MAG: PRC-barrel domain-containing protein [Candidatus Aenigmatarchaeota archaeon]
MSMKISNLYGMDIYTDKGKYIGQAKDFIIDLEKGEVIRISLENLTGLSGEEIKAVLRDKSILYSCVKSVSDIIVVDLEKKNPSLD